MKLYITPGSPYARIARIVVIEKQIEDLVEIIVAQTRTKDSPYYAINPSGRVPYLVRDDGARRYGCARSLDPRTSVHRLSSAMKPIAP
jgi:glutathione S-transferase